MKSALRRALSIADEIESFRFAGSADDPDRLYYSVHYLRELAIKLRAAAQGLDHPRLRDALERLPVNVDGHDFDGGVALYAELMGIAGFLHDAVEEWGEDPSRWQSPPAGAVSHAPRSLDGSSLNTKERDSLLKLVIGMAMAYHGYEPSADRSDIPGQIVSDLDRLGLSLHVDTVRKYLKEGLEFLPPKISEGDR